MGLELKVTTLNLLCTAFGLFFVAYGTFSYLIKERLFLGEAPLAVLIGIGLGPYGLGGIFNWASKEIGMDEVSLGLCRVVIGIQLTLVGVQLPYKYPWVEIRSLAVLLLPVMTLMWLATTFCIWIVIPSLPLLAGLVIATSATPTDPVLSNAIVKGAFADQYVSPRLRNLISAESGANDGFGYPFLFLAVHLLKLETTTEALTTWLFQTCLYTVGGAVLYGIVVGYICRRLIEFSPLSLSSSSPSLSPSSTSLSSSSPCSDSPCILILFTSQYLKAIFTNGMASEWPIIDDRISAYVIGLASTRMRFATGEGSSGLNSSRMTPR